MTTNPFELRRDEEMGAQMRACLDGGHPRLVDRAAEQPGWSTRTPRWWSCPAGAAGQPRPRRSCWWVLGMWFLQQPEPALRAGSKPSGRAMRRPRCSPLSGRTRTDPGVWSSKAVALRTIRRTRGYEHQPGGPACCSTITFCAGRGGGRGRSGVLVAAAGVAARPRPPRRKRLAGRNEPATGPDAGAAGQYSGRPRAGTGRRWIPSGASLAPGLKLFGTLLVMRSGAQLTPAQTTRLQRHDPALRSRAPWNGAAIACEQRLSSASPWRRRHWRPRNR